MNVSSIAIYETTNATTGNREYRVMPVTEAARFDLNRAQLEGNLADTLEAYYHGRLVCLSQKQASAMANALSGKYNRECPIVTFNLQTAFFLLAMNQATPVVN